MTTTLTHPAFQPYWVAFAHSRGARPEDLPRGVHLNIEFMAWIDAQWREFGCSDRAAFLAWLTERYGQVAA